MAEAVHWSVWVAYAMVTQHLNGLQHGLHYMIMVDRGSVSRHPCLRTQVDEVASFWGFACCWERRKKRRW